MSNVLQIDKVDQQHLSKKGNFVASLCPYWLKKTFFGGSILWNGVVLFAEHQAKPSQIHKIYIYNIIFTSWWWRALWKDGWNFPLAAFGGWRLYNQGRIWQILFEPTDMITLIIIITIVIINRSHVKRWTTSPKWYQSKLGHFFVSQLFWRSFTNICVEPISGRQRGKGNFQLNDFGNCCRVPAEEENGCYLSEYN